MKYYVLHEYKTGDKTRMRLLVTNVEVPEKNYECDNYQKALEAAVVKSAWFPSNGWQMALPEEEVARVSTGAAADALNTVIAGAEIPDCRGTMEGLGDGGGSPSEG